MRLPRNDLATVPSNDPGMGTFAERYGYRKVRDVIQREAMDAPLRNALWDAVRLTQFSNANQHAFRERNAKVEPRVTLLYNLWNQFFKDPIDTIPLYFSDALKQIRAFFMDAPWYDVYSFVEFLADASPNGAPLRMAANIAMKREMAAYRFVGKEIVEITDENEIAAIETAITTNTGPVATHLAAALGHLSDRQNPDYRNSIKESISAVEAAVKDLCGDAKATLGQALKKLPAPLPPAFEGAVSKLYGYTSDHSGIRHALSEESSVDAVEARFMLVACSAFVNFLRERSGKALP